MDFNNKGVTMTQTAQTKPISEKKARTTAQLWARREKIDQIMLKLHAERADITQRLKGELE